MKAFCSAILLALLDASSAHAGSIFNALINGSGARFVVRNCGTETCGTIAWGKQKFVVRRSDFPALFRDSDRRDKPVRPDRDEPTTIVDQTKSTEAASPTGIEDRTGDRISASRRSEEAAVVRSDERSTPPGSAVPDASAPPTNANHPLASQDAMEASRPESQSPMGTWIAENAEGRVRIEPCGQALCGVVAAANPGDTDWRNPDPRKRNRPLLGLPVLIDMKPTRNGRWEGQVYSAKSGYTYTATMALKSADVLRVEGCVLSGLFCSGQTWTRDKDTSAP
jgi:uncharacterized protein (DUF2147 family)